MTAGGLTRLLADREFNTVCTENWLGIQVVMDSCLSINLIYLFFSLL